MPSPPFTAHDLSNLVGKSPCFLRVLAMIERMARYDAPVLIQGETGTGKELAARAIHYLSSRRQAPFVALNCGAVPETLVETELFGYERGAFTDARQATSGLIAAAEGGTLFLDEIDSLPQRAQVSLLRFLQDKCYRSVGGRQERHSNVRIIAAASPRLRELLDSGAFRDDLAFRLNVLLLEMPPLRERGDDALLLAEHFIERHARHYAVPVLPLSADSLRWLAQHRWPGNVRELDNVVQRALLLSDPADRTDTLDLRPFSGITFFPLQAPVAAASAEQDHASHDATARGEALRVVASRASTALLATVSSPERASAIQRYKDARERALSQFERAYLQQLMAAASGNVTRAAYLAGKERRALGRLLKKHGI